MPKYAPARPKKNTPAAFAENSALPAMANPAPNQPEIPITVGDKTFAEPADSFAEYADFRQKPLERGAILANDFLYADGLVASLSTSTEIDTLLDTMRPWQRQCEKMTRRFTNRPNYANMGISDGAVREGTGSAPAITGANQIRRWWLKPHGKPWRQDTLNWQRT